MYRFCAKATELHMYTYIHALSWFKFSDLSIMSRNQDLKFMSSYNDFKLIYNQFYIYIYTYIYTETDWGFEFYEFLWWLQVYIQSKFYIWFVNEYIGSVQKLLDGTCI